MIGLFLFHVGNVDKLITKNDEIKGFRKKHLWEVNRVARLNTFSWYCWYQIHLIQLSIVVLVFVMMFSQIDRFNIFHVGNLDVSSDDCLY